MKTPTPPSSIKIINVKPTLTERVAAWRLRGPRIPAKTAAIIFGMQAAMVGAMLAYQLYQVYHTGQPPEDLENLGNAVQQDYTVWLSEPHTDPALYDPGVPIDAGDCIDDVIITAGDPSVQAGIPEFTDKTPYHLPPVDNIAHYTAQGQFIPPSAEEQRVELTRGAISILSDRGPDSPDRQYWLNTIVRIVTGRASKYCGP